MTGIAARPRFAPLNVALWTAQVLLALAYGVFGAMKAAMPLDQLAPMMGWIAGVSPLHAANWRKPACSI